MLRPTLLALALAWGVGSAERGCPPVVHSQRVELGQGMVAEISVLVSECLQRGADDVRVVTLVCSFQIGNFQLWRNTRMACVDSHGIDVVSVGTSLLQPNDARVMAGGLLQVDVAPVEGEPSVSYVVGVRPAANRTWEDIAASQDVLVDVEVAD